SLLFPALDQSRVRDTHTLSHTRTHTRKTASKPAAQEASRSLHVQKDQQLHLHRRERSKELLPLFHLSPTIQTPPPPLFTSRRLLQAAGPSGKSSAQSR